MASKKYSKEYLLLAGFVVYNFHNNKYISIYIILLFKPAAQAQVGKAKFFINCFRDRQSTCAMESWKTQLKEATNDWLLP